MASLCLPTVNEAEDSVGLDERQIEPAVSVTNFSERRFDGAVEIPPAITKLAEAYDARLRR